MKNPRDGASINHLARQVSPSNYHFIINSYADATLKNAYSYFLIDLNPKAEKVSGPKSRRPGPRPRRDHL